MSAPEKVVIGNAELWCGDCREVLPLLQGVDAIVSDPPYGIAYSVGGCSASRRGGLCKVGTQPTFANRTVTGDDEPFDPSPLLAMSPNVALWGGNHYADKLPIVPNGRWLFWDKNVPETVSFSQGELCWTTLRGSLRKIKHTWNGALRAGPEKNGPRVHPTQKPEAVMRWVLSFFPSAKVICDPYMGSGTTGVACMQTDRSFIGVEVEREYFDIACRRIEDAQRQGRLIA